MKNLKNCLLIIAACFLFSSKLIGQKDSLQKKMEFTMVTPFAEETSFKRIGNIISWKGGLKYGINDNLTLGGNLKSSLFISRDGTLVAPQLLPDIEMTFKKGAIGGELNVGYIYSNAFAYSLALKQKLNKTIKLIGSTLSQNFISNEIEPTKITTSQLYLFGIEKTWELGKKSKSELIAFATAGAVANGYETFDYRFGRDIGVKYSYGKASVIATYTNNVPVEGFPNYFVLIVKMSFKK